MKSNLLEDIVITDIIMPHIVHSEKGRIFEMKNRPHYGLSLCLSGQITYYMDGKEFVSDPTHAVLLPKGGCYSLHGDSEGLFPLVNFQCENLNCDTIVTFPLLNATRCIKHFNALSDLVLYHSSQLKLYGTFYELLHAISSESAVKSGRLSAITDYIEKNLSSPQLTNQTLAEQFNISEVYLRKLFANHYGTSPKQYILDIRLRKAKQMLTDTSLSVTSIAEECGFASLYHFCKIFKKKTGMTPSEYANENIIYHL